MFQSTFSKDSDLFRNVYCKRITSILFQHNLSALYGFSYLFSSTEQVSRILLLQWKRLYLYIISWVEVTPFYINETNKKKTMLNQTWIIPRLKNGTATCANTPRYPQMLNCCRKFASYIGYLVGTKVLTNYPCAGFWISSILASTWRHVPECYNLRVKWTLR